MALKAKYVGDPAAFPAEAVPDNFTAYGVDFPKGKWVDVPEDQEAKVLGNNHFETKGAAESDEGKKAADA
jgi:hypothetical protein